MAKASKGERGKSGKQEPSGQEIMRRRPPSDLALRPSRFEFDPTKAYSAEQLAKIGAISIKFTQLEHQIDFICSHILFTKSPFWLKFEVDKVLSTSTKLNLLDKSLDHSGLLDDLSKSVMRDALTQFRTYRTYRNAIIHHSIYDPEKGIGSYLDETNKAYQIMVSPEALSNLYNLICALQQELYKVDLLFRIETDAQRPGTINRETGEFEPYPPTQLREQVIPELRKELGELQKQREHLPQLPKFPDADLIRKLSEEQARRLDPEERGQEIDAQA